MKFENSVNKEKILKSETSTNKYESEGRNNREERRRGHCSKYPEVAYHQIYSGKCGS